MKKISYYAAVAIVALGLGSSACSQSSAPTTADNTPVAAGEATPSLNVRYVDMDSVSANYNLAKDLQEAHMRAISRLNSAQQQKAGEIQKVAGQIQQKVQNNGYLSEVSYNADMQRVNKMQQDAETYLGNLQRSQEQELAQLAIQMQDSINSFIKDYNAKHGYDAILIKSAGLYFNPALDITDEVIAGLNARYTKVGQ